ncbi:MAG: amino-acid N-acetyltransferase [Parahaliea sp.]
MTTTGRDHIRWFRSTAPYINAHRRKTFVLMLGGEAAQHPNFANIIHDIALLNSLGVRLVLVHGNRPQIDERLERAGIEHRFHAGMRITDSASMPLVTDAAGSLRAQIEALLSMGLPNSPMQGASIRVCSGNFISARPIGVLDGIDFQHTGRVRRVDVAGIREQLAAGSIVLLSPLGYSPTGEVFNLHLEDIAVHCASAIGADKLLLFGADRGLEDSDGTLLHQIAVGAMGAMQFRTPEQARLADTARRACLAGVERCQLISYQDDCAMLEELFTHDGNGTLVAKDDYEQSRWATINDVGGILELIEPLEQQGVLLKRSRELLENEISHFRLLERDGRILACAALYPYPEESCGEIACVVSHPQYRGSRRGERLLRSLEQEARQRGLSQVFVLTTQTAHWFIEQGFAETGRETLPAQKQKLYNLQRNSKVFFKNL